MCIFVFGMSAPVRIMGIVNLTGDSFYPPSRMLGADGRLDLTMVPSLDHHSDTNIGVMRMHSHQVHGLWSGTVVLDDGRKLQIRDMYAFCEYVENRW